MGSKAFRVGGETIRRGETRRLELPVARLPTGTWLGLPLTVLRGGRPGPTLLLDGALHGDEVNGYEIIRRVVRRLGAQELRGTVLAVPVVNLFGFLNQTRYLPDRRDLNRSFPGSPYGSLAARLAHLFVTEILVRADAVIDFHTGSRERANLPQVRGRLSDPAVRRLAETFAAPVMIEARTIEGSLREVADTRGIPLIVFEGGEPLRFNADVVDHGVAGTLRVLRELGIWDGRPPDGMPECIELVDTRWVRATRSGLFRAGVDLGQRVPAEGVLGEIGDLYGGEVRRLRSPADGIVIGLAQNPLVHQGDAVVHLGIHG